ncbi:MAG TPA: hypothetical protein VFS34_06990 [Thermoanaerobaculia bacterium]|nr:hypothetical protein [Thermoanaerobaculia bacterium]
MKKIASLLAPLALAVAAMPAGAATLSNRSLAAPVHRGAAAVRRLATTPAVAHQATGVGINLDLVGRIPTSDALFKTSIDIANNTNTDTQVDAYFSGLIGGSHVDIIVSITATGIVQQGASQLASLSVYHSDDFIDDLHNAGYITSTEESGSIIGSLFVIYDSPSAGLFDQIGQGSVQARFYSTHSDGGTIGVSANGHELTQSEPRSLVGIVHDTRGESGTPQLYTNFFVNNEGYAASDGSIVNNNGLPIKIRLTGYSNATGQKTGQSSTISIGPFETVGLSKVSDIIRGSSTDDTFIVFVDIVDGDSAISGLSSTNDVLTLDPSAAQLRPADWSAGQPQ